MLGVLTHAGGALALPGAYTDAASFAANVPFGAFSADFEALAGGTVVSGTTLTPTGSPVGVILPPPLSDVLEPGQQLDLVVVLDAGDNPASSGSHSLGVVDPGNFNAVAAGTPIGFSFTQPVAAFGLTVITPEEPSEALFDGDLRLVVSGEPTASLALADGQLLGTFGGREYRAFFLGVVGAASFTAASLEYDPATPTGGFLLNLDDLTVPEPAGATMLVLGWLALQGLAQRRARAKESP